MVSLSSPECDESALADSRAQEPIVLFPRAHGCLETVAEPIRTADEWLLERRAGWTKSRVVWTFICLRQTRSSVFTVTMWLTLVPYSCLGCRVMQ